MRSNPQNPRNKYSYTHADYRYSKLKIKYTCRVDSHFYNYKLLIYSPITVEDSPPIKKAAPPSIYVASIGRRSVELRLFKNYSTPIS